MDTATVVDQLTAKRANLSARLEALDASVAAYERQYAARHWTETDSATGSGIRRKPNHKADNARFNSYAREAQVYSDRDATASELAVVDRKLTNALAERDRPTLTRDDILGAVAVRTKTGWHRVAKVNAKTVAVETGYSWTDKYTFDRVLETLS